MRVLSAGAGTRWEDATSGRKTPPKGTFVTFEGIEGCGKTTQVRLLARNLRRLGIPHVVTREPGGTPIGDEIRAILLRASSSSLDPMAELLLYEGSRAEHCSRVIAPALEEGRVVLCDRFTDATLAYQGYGRGLDRRAIRTLNAMASATRSPDLTVLLDCPVEVGLARSRRRLEASGQKSAEGRFEAESHAFHERVRRGYLAIAHAEPERVWVASGEGPQGPTSKAILSRVLGATGFRDGARPRPKRKQEGRR